MLCPFETLEDYLTLLHAFVGAIPTLLPSLHRPMVYFCAAVSDFYVPQSEMSTHKIQSSEHTELKLTLARTPKMLGVLRALAPEAVFVSFKLETDMGILLKKASAAMVAYGINVVVANELKTRREFVTLVSVCVCVCVCMYSYMYIFIYFLYVYLYMYRLETPRESRRRSRSPLRRSRPSRHDWSTFSQRWSTNNNNPVGCIHIQTLIATPT
jgi:hypothetical protein